MNTGKRSFTTKIKIEENIRKIKNIREVNNQIRVIEKTSYYNTSTTKDYPQDEATTEFVQVVVFRSLQREYSLTSWTEEECSKDGDPEMRTF